MAVYNFTLQHNFKLILTYHSQGEVIYWQFQNYKDWFIQNYNRPGYTIEVGLGTNPLPITQFRKIYEDNLGILVLGAIL